MLTHVRNSDAILDVPTPHRHAKGLPDGTQLLRRDRFDTVKEQLETERANAGLADPTVTDAMLAVEHQIMPVHPRFRIIGLSNPPPAAGGGGSKQSWLSAETVGLFSFHPLPTLSTTSFQSILRARHPGLASEQARALVAVSQQLAAAADDVGGTGSATLSPRQLLRVARRTEARPEDLRGILDRTCLGALLPEPYRESFRNTLDSVVAALGSNVAAASSASSISSAAARISIVPAPASSSTATTPTTGGASTEQQTLTIGDVTFAVGKPAAPELVPDTFFVDIPSHTALMHEMAKDLALGESHMLLIGPQGTGKNKARNTIPPAFSLLSRWPSYRVVGPPEKRGASVRNGFLCVGAQGKLRFSYADHCTPFRNDVK